MLLGENRIRMGFRRYPWRFLYILPPICPGVMRPNDQTRRIGRICSPTAAAIILQSELHVAAAMAPIRYSLLKKDPTKHLVRLSLDTSHERTGMTPSSNCYTGCSMCRCSLLSCTFQDGPSGSNPLKATREAISVIRFFDS